MNDPRFLPLLKRSDAAPSPRNDASWSREAGGTGALAKYATALELAIRELPPERFKSIPTPLARPLLFEQALFQKHHPAHRPVEGEWRGLLATIGLADYFGVAITVRTARLPENGGGVMPAIRKFTPRGEDDAWSRWGLISVAGRLVGGTSPRTIVFTGIRPLMSGTPVPFQSQGRLTDPTEHYKSRGDADTLALLLQWIRDTRRELGGTGELGMYLGVQPTSAAAAGVSRAQQTLEAFERWEQETEAALRESGGRGSVSLDGYGESPFALAGFPDGSPAARVLGKLRPIRATAAGRPSTDLKLRDGALIPHPGASGVLYRNGQPYSGQVHLPRGFTQVVHDGRFQIELTGDQLGDSDAPDFGQLFQQRLIKLANVTPNGQALRAGGQSYLFPFVKNTLDHLSADQLSRFVSADGDANAGITVVMELPLQNHLSLRYQHRYEASQIQTEYVTPDLAVWPDFVAPHWKHYLFVEKAAARDNNLELEPHADVEASHEADANGAVRWGRTTTFPAAWVGRADRAEGLFLAKLPTEVKPTDEEWEISIDFGSTHTRVFRATTAMAGQRLAEPVELKPRALALTGNPNFGFLPLATTPVANPEEPKTLLQLPLQHAPERPGSSWLPADGIVVWESLLRAEKLPGVKTDLKWQEENKAGSARAFVSQIFLSAAAEAAARGGRVTAVRAAYPSVFPEYLRFQHEQQWGLLRDRYGVTVHPLSKESSALAAFLAEGRGANVNVNVLAADIGGSTADLAVWSRGKQTHGDSVRLAGDLITRLVRNDQGARHAIAEAARSIDGRLRVTWIDDNPDHNALAFNALLRHIAKEHAGGHPSSSVLAKWMSDPNGEGIKVVAHVGYLAASVSYLLGMLARHLPADTVRYEVHFAGRGSEFLYWLVAFGDGAPTSVPEHFFRAGLHSAGSPEVDVTLPGDEAKQEVGRGLLSTSLGSEPTEIERTTFMGEGGFEIDSEALKWDSLLSAETLTRLAEDPPLPAQRPELTRFIEAFHSDGAGRMIAKALNLSPDVLRREDFRATLENGLRRWIGDARQKKSHLALEPIFVHEVKALLEHSTGRPGLFR